MYHYLKKILTWEAKKILGEEQVSFRLSKDLRDAIEITLNDSLIVARSLKDRHGCKVEINGEKISIRKSTGAWRLLLGFPSIYMYTGHVSVLKDSAEVVGRFIMNQPLRFLALAWINAVFISIFVLILGVIIQAVFNTKFFENEQLRLQYLLEGGTAAIGLCVLLLFGLAVIAFIRWLGQSDILTIKESME